MDSSGSQVSLKSVGFIINTFAYVYRRKSPSRDLPASNRHLHLRRNLIALPNVAVASLRVEMRNIDTDRGIGAIVNTLAPGTIEGSTGNGTIGRKMPENNQQPPQGRYQYRKP